MEMSADKKGLSKSYVLREVEDSLKRLGTDYIDLYQAHTDDTATPLEETLEAMTQLVKDGKVRTIGASNYSGKRLEEALAVSREKNLARYGSLQPEYNLYDRSGYESDLEQVAKKNELGVIPYFSLAAGFLTGKYKSEADLGDKARGGMVKKYLNERGFRILNTLDEVAKEYSATSTEVALAWLMARPSVTAPIASATNLDQLKRLVNAADLKLGPEAIGQLDRASAERDTAHSS